MASYDDTATVSGSVVSIENGADDVPTKSLVVTIPPTLSGVSSVSETQTGRNLLNYADITNSYRITSLTDNGGGSFTVVASGLGAYIDHVIKVKAGQAYSIKCTSATNDEGNASQIGVVNVYDGSDDTTTLLLNGASISTRKGFTPTGSYILVRNKVTDGSGAGTGTIVEPQLEVGSTAHAYEPYTTPTTYTAELGETVYGGSVDFVSGVKKKTYAIVDLGSLNWVKVTSNVEAPYFSTTRAISPLYNYQNGNTNVISNNYSYAPIGSTGTSDGFYIIHSSYVRIRDANYSSMTTEQFKTAITGTVLVYEQATPTDFTFTGQEIPTRLGYNAFWSEQGDTELTYYKSGYGFTSVTVNQKDGNDELIATKTAKLHKVIYGGKADVVRGTCEPKNILLPSSTDSASTVVNGVTRSYSLDSQTWTLEGSNTKTDANWLIYNGANYVLSKVLIVGDTYTYSHTLSANCYSQFTYKDTNGATRSLGYLIGNANKNASVTFTVPSDFVELLRFQIGVIKTATSVSEEAVFQLEKASSKTEYAPYFDPFTFPPISMETDEGENTLFANEGTSAITYRKAVD